MPYRIRSKQFFGASKLRETKMQRVVPAAKNYLIQRKKTVLLVVVAATITLLVSTSISVLLERNYDINLPSIGNIKTVGVEVYMDEQLKTRSDKVDWGTVKPGSIVNVTRYVRNVSNENTDLSMTVENWHYLNASGVILNETSYINLHWDGEGKTLKPNQKLKVVFTLSVDHSYEFVNFIVGEQVKSFAFDMKISPLD